MPSRQIRVPDKIFEELNSLRKKLGFKTIGDLVTHLLNVYKLLTEGRQVLLQSMHAKMGFSSQLSTEGRQSVDSRQSVDELSTGGLPTEGRQSVDSHQIVDSLSTDELSTGCRQDNGLSTDSRQSATDDRIEVPEVTAPTCPTCGCVGTPLMAIHSKGWIHRLLVECDGCGKQFVVYLGKSGLRKVSDFSSLKRKYPQCKLVPYEEFIKRYKPVRSSADAVDFEF